MLLLRRLAGQSRIFRSTRTTTSLGSARPIPSRILSLLSVSVTSPIFFSCRRSYTSSSESPTSKKSQENEKSGANWEENDLPWLAVLESAANAPWLSSTPPDQADRLRRAFALLFHILIYLGRPLSSNGTAESVQLATEQFLLAFESAPVASTSEIARARHAVALLTRTITKDISSIPPSSPLRTQHPQVFALTDALVPLCELHLQNVQQGKVPSTSDVVDAGGKWGEFWMRAQPIVLALGEELDQSGFGLGEDLEKEVKAEQTTKKQEKNGDILE